MKTIFYAVMTIVIGSSAANAAAWRWCQSATACVSSSENEKTFDTREACIEYQESNGGECYYR